MAELDEPAVVARLSELLRRDPTDRDVAFLVSLVSREPRRLYASERQRLKVLLRTSPTPRGEVIARAAELLLATR